MSLKLIQQLREQSAPLGSSSSLSQSANKGSSSTTLGRTLNEITLNESIRYAPGDEVERWLNHLLCLDATVVQKLTSGCPLPENCDLYPFGVPWWCYFFFIFKLYNLAYLVCVAISDKTSNLHGIYVLVQALIILQCSRNCYNPFCALIICSFSSCSTCMTHTARKAPLKNLFSIFKCR